MSDAIPEDVEQAEVEPTPVEEQPPGAVEPPAEPAPAEEALVEADPVAVPQPTTQGDIRPGDDEHGVDTTPPQSQDQPNTGAEPGDPHEPMNKMDERAEPNTRGNAGSGD